MFKKLGVLLFSVFIIGACSQDTAADPKKEVQTENDKNTDDRYETDKGSSISLGSSIEDLKQQKGGVLVKDLTLEMELNSLADSFQDDHHLKSELEKLTNQTKDPHQIQKGMIRLLGSPNYGEPIKEAEDFQPDFEEPYLPDPTKQGTESNENSAPPENAIILLDASSSMLLASGNQIRMDIAKDAVSRFAKTIGEQSDVSLVVYGHKGSQSDGDKELSCSGIEEVFPLGPYDQSAFSQALDSFESKGWTPLAGAISKAAEMTNALEGNITIYIVSDGIETCDGDPIAAAKVFAERNDGNQVNIIGFQVNKEAEDQLTKVAEAGNGQYYYAENADDIHKTIEEKWVLPSTGTLVWAHTMAPNGWEQLDESNRLQDEVKVIKDIMEKENERYQEALKIIYNEEWLEEETYNELSDQVNDRYQKMREAAQELETRKRTEIKEKAAEISDRVAEWVEKMKALKEQQGETW